MQYDNYVVIVYYDSICSIVAQTYGGARLSCDVCLSFAYIVCMLLCFLRCLFALAALLSLGPPLFLRPSSTWLPPGAKIRLRGGESAVD